MSADRLAQLQQAIDKRSAEQLLRTPVTLQHYNGRLLSVAGTPYLNFSGNDYLGLATEPEVLQAYADGARDFGAGSTGSPLVTGQHQVHARLCDTLCDWLGTEQVMLFSSGFAANQTMLQTLAQKGDTLVLDKLSHASLIDGALHSDAVLKRFAHNDIAQLEMILQQTAQPLVVTEGIFSMDGDSPDLRTMQALCQQFNAPLLLDDAHGLGVTGPEGKGSAAVQGIAATELFCLMANFGKALGVGGAFIGGSKTVIDYLTQFGRHYVYSTALSPALCAAVIKSIELCRSQQWRRDKLHSNIALFRQLAEGLMLLKSESAIQGVVLGSSERALAVSQQLKAAGFWLSAIRSPTVPKGSERLRITLSAQHTEYDIKQLVQQLRQLI
ncbi:aminotransferase class I/II-fold pyridoxal phosphate-dependent enzyme [Rheinheimera aquimaris]|jgi:8-amino-7-oxononanoate synthase|uniref:aminotransferase class I/II-fold pyridoxal phosphate-dependent enzyme n=1 Tax=Rheinheimera aquimaris TaxID=412437 RepID=UPI00106587AF|nr:8-amino-7-oxononanoate synthase [Rheinheimera aquimaris]MCD1599376.1 8-amino-7-oxononanoate synthase [Rheinheimera aquimaris]|tara:strand:+ start:13638 stop:14789 length:1152 start_codon:yes stop_codon:yes gene_type:complete